MLLTTDFLSPEDEPGSAPAAYKSGLIAVLNDATAVMPYLDSIVSEETCEMESFSVNIMHNLVADRAELNFVMTETTEVRFVMTDVRGTNVSTLNAGMLVTGQQSMNLPIQNLTSGAFSVTNMKETGVQQT